MDDSRPDVNQNKLRGKISDKKTVRILGIDPGVATLGWGVVDATLSRRLKVNFCDYGVITTLKGIPHPIRLVELKLDISEVLSEYKPDIVSVERLFFCRNQKTAISVGEARGVVLLAIGEVGCEVVEYTPLQVKSIICGNGKASKKEMQDMVQSLLSLDERPRPDDAADGLALGICAAQDLFYDHMSQKKNKPATELV